MVTAGGEEGIAWLGADFIVSVLERNALIRWAVNEIVSIVHRGRVTASEFRQQLLLDTLDFVADGFDFF